MEHHFKRTKTSNPSLKPSFISKISFFFVLPIFLLSRRRDFSAEDVYDLKPSFSSRTLGNRLETAWNLEKIKESPSLLGSLLKIFGLEYVLWGVLLMVVEVTVMLLTPTLIGKIVAFFGPSQQVNSDIALYIILLIGITLLRSIVLHSYKFAVKKLALKTKIACSTLIYRKALRVNTYQTAKHFGGQTVTLITRDLSVFDSASTVLHQLLVAIMKITAMTYLMYKQIGVAAFVGVALMTSFTFLKALLGLKSIHFRLTTAKKTDLRLQMIQEVLATIRVIKMYNWESFFCKSIHSTRRKEVKSFQTVILMRLMSIALGLFNKRLSLYACFVTFAAFGNVVTPEKAFVVVGCFATLGLSLNIYIPVGLITLAEMKAMLIRVNKYLVQDEVGANRPVKIDAKRSKITVSNVTVNLQSRVVLKDINLSIQPIITVITGGVGSGKSTLLKAILGETEQTGTIEIAGKVSYASQEPWLFPGTIRQNIVFNEVFNRWRYANVLRACALEKDLETFTLGDQTILSDRGLNLSQGQKDRINLARAVYKLADVYLLDECLSTVDVPVGRHIFQECIKKLLGGKVCILVSHVHSFIDHVDTIVFLNKGRVEFKESYETDKPVTRVTVEITPEVEEEKQCNKFDEAQENSPLLIENTPPSTNVYNETGKHGSIKSNVYYKYLSSGGIKLIFFLIIVLIVKQAVDSSTDYFVRFWVDSELKLSSANQQYGSNSTEHDQALKSRNSVLSQYSFGLLASALLIVVKLIALYVLISRASIRLHRSLIDKVVNAAMPFFDKNLAGNIVNKFSRDFSIVDELLPYSVLDSVEITLTIISIMIIVITTNPWFLLPTVCYVVLLYTVRRLYLRSGRNIRRIEGSVRSPVIGHMQATFDGLTTIRALEAQETVKREFHDHFDVYNSAMYMHLATVTAYGLYLDVLTGCYIAIVLTVLPFFKNSITASTAGLAITQSFALSGLLHWCVSQWSELELHMTSAERLLEYNEAQPEDKSGITIKDWPSSGKIVYDNVGLQYTQNSNRVLQNISFTIEHGEKVGIVGRTGAGKSSLVAALFRLYPFEGSITIGDVDASTVGVEELRSKISIIPQQATLFSGTIRSNLDPNGKYDDKTLWNALERVAMKNKISNLDLITSECNGTFSIGEVQLVCLARAVLQDNSIVVLDEATENVDALTERFIHKTIRRIFASRAIIIITHRLHTIMDCDKVLVMEAGRIVQNDTPKNLLDDVEGMFYDMVKQAGMLQLKM